MFLELFVYLCIIITIKTYVSVFGKWDLFIYDYFKL